LLQCNQKPKLSKFDRAIEERSKIINHPFTFVENPISPEQYIYNNVFGWYVYNVWEPFQNQAPTSLYNDISNKPQDWSNTLTDSISLSDEKAQDKLKEIQKAYKLVGSSSFVQGVFDSPK